MHRRGVACLTKAITRSFTAARRRPPSATAAHAAPAFARAAKKPVKPGDAFGVPGHGSSMVTSLVTIVAFVGSGSRSRTCGWSSRSSCRRRRRCTRSSSVVATDGFARLDARAAHVAQPVPRVRRVRARLPHGDSRRRDDGCVADRARRIRSADRVLPAAAAARLPAARSSSGSASASLQSAR